MDKETRSMEHSLPGHVYHDNAILEEERRRIFYTQWHYVGHRTQIRDTGQYFVTRVADQELIVIRDREDELRAFYNVCPHRGHCLLHADGQVRAIVCPYHAWKFDTQGRLQAARYSSEVPGCDCAAITLSPVAIEDFCGFLFVNLDLAAKPLAEQVPGLADEMRGYVPYVDRLRLVRREHFSIASNWKNVVENYLESYHIPVAHRQFARSYDFDTGRIAANGLYCSYASKAKDRGCESQDALYAEHPSWWLWPNLALTGSPQEGLRVFSATPDGPCHTHEVYDFYYTDLTLNDQQEAQIEYVVGTLQPEDIAIVESVQKGQRSLGYQHGMLMVDDKHSGWSEFAISHFQTLIREFLSLY